MKEFIFTVEHLIEGDSNYYKINANDIEEAKNLFMKACVPLFHEMFDWYDFTSFIEHCDVQITIMNLEDVIEL